MSKLLILPLGILIIALILLRKAVDEYVKSGDGVEKCPECGGKLHYWESPFMNSLGESERRGYTCMKCDYIREE